MLTTARNRLDLLLSAILLRNAIKKAFGVESYFAHVREIHCESLFYWFIERCLHRRVLFGVFDRAVSLPLQTCPRRFLDITGCGWETSLWLRNAGQQSSKATLQLQISTTNARNGYVPCNKTTFNTNMASTFKSIHKTVINALRQKFI